MTQPENAETNSQPLSRYDRCDPHYLRQLREAAGMDLVVLARTACLSVAQVQALESENAGHVFYSNTIKRQAYKRLLMILGAEPPTVEVPTSLRDAHQVAEVHLNTLDQIVAMSHQPPMNFTWTDRVREGVLVLMARKQFIGALSLLVGSLVLFALYGPLHLGDGTTSAATEPVKASPVVVAAPVAPPASVVAPAPVAAPLVASVASAVPVVVAAVASAPVQTATAPTNPAATSVPPKATTAACAYSAEALPQLPPFVARKEGNYVYLVSSANAEVCVVDGNKQATLVLLKAGEGRTVTGAAPWQVSGVQLKQVQIYFQGGRVTLPEDIQRLKLVEQPVTR